MAVFSGTIFSQALGKMTHLTVILPHDVSAYRRAGGGKARTLILLHGLTDDDSVWTRRTSLERYADEKGLAVLMPDGEESFYTNMAYGPRFFDYVSKELPELGAQMFGLDVNPGSLYIAGLSMGGYGALLCALSDPDRYAGCGAFSSAADMKGIAKAVASDPDGGMVWMLKSIFGDSMEVPDSGDLFALGRKADSPLRIFMTCGRQDSLYASNAALRDSLRENAQLQVEWDEWDGVHEWGFWDESIRKFLDRFM